MRFSSSSRARAFLKSAINWTSPRMFALLLLDRPRKPVGPDDDILFEWLKPTAPIAQRYLWICAELKAGQCSLPLSALLPPQSPSSWMCKVQLHEVVLMYQGSSVHHRHRQGRSRRRAAGESGMAEQRKTCSLSSARARSPSKSRPVLLHLPFGVRENRYASWFQRGSGPENARGSRRDGRRQRCGSGVAVGRVCRLVHKKMEQRRALSHLLLRPLIFNGRPESPHGPCLFCVSDSWG